MIVKLKDNIDLEKFIQISFGTKGVDSLPYFGYFSTENLRKVFNATIENDVLNVEILDSAGNIIELGYKTFEDKAIWDVYMV